MSKQPKDDGGNIIPVLGLRFQSGYIVPFTTSANTSPQFSGHTSVVTIYSTSACFIECGDANVIANTSNSHFIASSIPYDISTKSDSGEKLYLSVIGATAPGTLYISERD